VLGSIAVPVPATDGAVPIGFVSSPAEEVISVVAAAAAATVVVIEVSVVEAA
jgi:hypothetical protein